MGGRCAEEIVFDDITSGASGDIKMVTKTARHMVCDWGMTELGTVALGENKDHVFLGQEIQRSQNYSESTAIKIDNKISEIVDIQHHRALDILKENREALDVCAQALLEHETIEGKHVYEILEFGEIRSPIVETRSITEEASEESDSNDLKTEEPANKEDDGLEGDESPIQAPA
jgi:cell division protease FtsH